MEKIDWFTPLIGFAGVLIGASLTPIISNLIENTKTRNSLKTKLVASVYVFFNIRKFVFELSNINAFRSQALKFMWDDLRSPMLPDFERNEIQREYNSFERSLENNLEKINQYGLKLIETESDIFSTLSLVQAHYGKSKFTKLENFIKPHIDRSNSMSMLFEYKKLTRSEHEDISKVIYDKFIDKFKELNQECDRTLALISSTI